LGTRGRHLQDRRRPDPLASWGGLARGIVHHLIDIPAEFLVRSVADTSATVLVVLDPLWRVAPGPPAHQGGQGGRPTPSFATGW